MTTNLEYVDRDVYVWVDSTPYPREYKRVVCKDCGIAMSDCVCQYPSGTKVETVFVIYNEEECDTLFCDSEEECDYLFFD